MFQWPVTEQEENVGGEWLDYVSKIGAKGCRFEIPLFSNSNFCIIYPQNSAI